MTDVQRRWYPLGGDEPSVRGPAGVLAKAAKKGGPVDPLTGPKLALVGRVVTMDEAFTVRADAVICIDRGSIVAVQDRAMPAPAGFDEVAPVDTGGTLFATNFRSGMVASWRRCRAYAVIQVFGFVRNGPPPEKATLFRPPHKGGVKLSTE